MKSRAIACFLAFGMFVCAAAVSAEEAEEAVVERKLDVGFFSFSLGYFLPLTLAEYDTNFGLSLEGGALLGGFFRVGALMNYGTTTGKVFGLKFTEEYIAGGGLVGFAIPHPTLSDTGRPRYLLSLDYGIMGARAEGRFLGISGVGEDVGHLFRLKFESLLTGGLYGGSEIAYITHQDGTISDVFYSNLSFTFRF